MGSPEFSVPTLLSLGKAFTVTGVITQPDKRAGRGRANLPTAVKTAALETGLPVAEPTQVSSEESLALLRQWAPEVIVVAAYGKILPRRILELPPMGCVNLHASLLPRHRGASPISAAILAGDTLTGLTTMLMDDGMDTGPILLKKEIPVLPDDTAGSLHDRLLQPGAELVVETLRRMVEKTIEPQPQNHQDATYTRPLSKEDGRIEWQKDAEFVSRFVRAMNPWPVAFSYLFGETIRVWSVKPEGGIGSPGVITVRGEEGILVGAGQGLIRLLEVQAPGRRRMTAAEFARGRRLTEGDRFQDSR